MRCLYCGKELALLKRWTGGGEFCSDGHRQQYQEEYNQLALNRLLQAKPPGAHDNEAKSEPSPQESKPSRSRTAETERPAEKQVAASTKAIASAKAVPAIEAPKPQPVSKPQPIEAPKPQPIKVAEPEPEPEPEIEFVVDETPVSESEPFEPEFVQESQEESFQEDDEPAPCEMSGFLVEIPVPAFAEVMAMSRTDSEFEYSASPAIPTRETEAWSTQLVSAGPIEYIPTNGIVDFVTSPRDRKLDVREFVRSAPVVEVDLYAAAETQLPQMIEEPMEILIFPHPPQGSPPLWDEPSRDFPFEKELGALARVPFRTTGIQDNEDATDPIESLSDAEMTLAPPPVSPVRDASPIKEKAEASRKPAEPIATPVAASVVRPVATAPIPPVATPVVPPVAIAAVPPVATAVIPPVATAVVPPVATAVVPEARQDGARSKDVRQDDARSKDVRQDNARPTAEPRVAAEPTPARSTFLKPPIATSAPKPTETIAAVAKTPDVAKAPDAAKVPEVAAPAPPVTRPLPLTLHGLAAGRGKPVQVFAAVTAGVDLQVPRSSSLPLRPTMTLGPAIAEKAPEKVEEKKPERSVIVKADPKKGQPGRPDPRFANGKGRKDNRPAEPEKIETEARQDTPRAPQKPEQKPIAASAPVKTQEKVADKPTEKPAEKLIERETEKTPAKPAARPAASMNAPAMNAPSINEEKRERVRDNSLPAPLAAPYSSPDLGLPSLNLEASGGFWSRLPVAGKAGVALLLIAVIGGVFFMMRGGGAAAAGPQIVEAPAITAAEGGWITDWGAEPGVRKAHEISVLRPTLNMTDYRISFEAQIEAKALGWIYRAQDAKNFYVSKLEIVKAGLEPTVALVRYAIVNGEEQAHSQFPLTMPVRIDTLYKVRFDAVGNHFTTWIQDQKVDDWTDERLKTGGVGLYSDRGERISLKGSMRVAPLVIKK